MAWPGSAWLQLSFSPFLVWHPGADHGTFKTYSIVQYVLKKIYFKGLRKISLKLDLFLSLLWRLILSDIALVAFNQSILLWSSNYAFCWRTQFCCWWKTNCWKVWYIPVDARHLLKSWVQPCWREKFTNNFGRTLQTGELCWKMWHNPVDGKIGGKDSTTLIV